MAAARRVDAHAHIFDHTMKLDPAAWHRPPRPAPLMDYLLCLKRAGIERAVFAGASLFGTDNSYTLAATSADPRLRTTVIVDPKIGLPELAAMARSGAVGVRLQWRSLPQVPDLTSPDYKRLLCYVADLGWHVELHDVGPRLPGSIALLEEAGVDLVIDHFARPSLEKGTTCPGFVAALEAVARGRTWIKISGGFRVGPEVFVAELTKTLIAHAGAERLVWGSDWPFAAYEDKVRYEDTLAQFEAICPDPGFREQMHRTAGRLYFGDSD